MRLSMRVRPRLQRKRPADVSRPDPSLKVTRVPRVRGGFAERRSEDPRSADNGKSAREPREPREQSLANNANNRNNETNRTRTAKRTRAAKRTRTERKKKPKNARPDSRPPIRPTRRPAPPSADSGAQGGACPGRGFGVPSWVSSSMPGAAGIGAGIRRHRTLRTGREPREKRNRIGAKPGEDRESQPGRRTAVWERWSGRLRRGMIWLPEGALDAPCPGGLRTSCLPSSLKGEAEKVDHTGTRRATQPRGCTVAATDPRECRKWGFYGTQ